MQKTRRTTSMRSPRMTRPRRPPTSNRRRTAPTSSTSTSRERNSFASLAMTRMAKEESMASSTRTETDSFGPIEVSADAYWGAQTERSIGNFPFGPREQLPLEIAHALGFIKQAAARVNARIAGLDPELAEIIQQAAGE